MHRLYSHTLVIKSCYFLARPMRRSLNHLRGISGIALLGLAGAYYTYQTWGPDNPRLNSARRHNPPRIPKMTVDQKFEVRHCLPPTLEPDLDAVLAPSNGGL